MFHRFRIGAMDATVISDGPLVLAPAAEIFPGIGATGLSDERVTIEQNCLLLETGGKRVLFDNGLGSERRYGPHSGRLLASLREAGVDPTSIDAMVLTHGHCDHCWGTMGDDGTPNFPNATLYLAREDIDFWTSDITDPSLADDVDGVAKHLLPLRDRMVFVRDGEEFLPGVQAWLTPGHTPGHMAYLFAGGWCLSGDVAFHDPLSFRFPDAESVFDTDRAEAVATRRLMLDRLAQERLRVVGYHQPWPGFGRVERRGNAYRFVAEAAVDRVIRLIGSTG